MKRAVMVLVAVLGGCSSGNEADGGGGLYPPGSPPPGSHDGADAGTGGCNVALSYDPRKPTASASTRITVSAQISGLPGIPQPTWHVLFDGAPVDFAQSVGGGGFSIDFIAVLPGVYDVSLELVGAPAECRPDPLPINVAAEGASSTLYRLRIVPPPNMFSPPMEKNVVVNGGGAMDLGTTAVESGQRVIASIMGPNGGIPAYVRFSPQNAPDAIVEAFADGTGQLQTWLLPQSYSVLVIPAGGIAARRFPSWSPFADLLLPVGGGALVTGTVRGPDGLLGGARVQVSIDGVPSTLATTAPDGSFALRAELTSGTITIEVTPDPASGLPRLVATSPPPTPGVPQLDLGVPLQIRYATNVTHTNLAGTLVRKQATALAGARVTFVGPMVAGMVTAGTSVTAAGDVRISAVADDKGRLPDVFVPVAQLSAVVAGRAGDLAVVELDTAGAVATIDVPEMPPIAMSVLPATGTDGLAGATLDVVPLGALAQAGVPTVHVVAAAAGALGTSLPAGGRFDLRFRDPFGRGAPLVVADRTLSTIATSYRLPSAIELRGRVKLDGTQALANAAIQVLCNSCSGLERNRPIAEAVSGITGQFVLAVPDPGTR